MDRNSKLCSGSPPAGISTCRARATRHSYFVSMRILFVSLCYAATERVELATDGPGGARIFTESELEAYNGTKPDRPIYLAVAGAVFDVTAKGAHLYGPGGSYSAFAGRACGRGIVLSSLEAEDVSDEFDDFDEGQRATLDGWVRFYDEKYGPAVGTLLYDPPAQRKARLLELKARRASEDAERDLAKKARLLATLRDDCGGRVMSDAELGELDGVDGRGLALAIGGHVLDVSKSVYLYGPKAPRAMYAGRKITRAAALRKADAETVAREDDIDDFTQAQLLELRERVEFYLLKFPKIALLESWIHTHGVPFGAASGLQARPSED